LFGVRSVLVLVQGTGAAAQHSPFGNVYGARGYHAGQSSQVNLREGPAGAGGLVQKECEASLHEWGTVAARLVKACRCVYAIIDVSRPCMFGKQSGGWCSTPMNAMLSLLHGINALHCAPYVVHCVAHSTTHPGGTPSGITVASPAAASCAKGGNAFAGVATQHRHRASQPKPSLPPPPPPPPPPSAISGL
jgi:hypothetical protein